MSMPYIDFRPAEYHDCKKDKYIVYYVTNPATGKLHRKIVRLNRIKDRKTRQQYAAHLCHVINERLYSGWNPFDMPDGIKGYTILESLEIFLKEKERSSRYATMVSYRSYCSIFKSWLEDNGFTETPTTNINDAVLTRFMTWVDDVRKPTPRTYNNYLAFLGTLFSFLKERGIIDDEPSPRTGKRKVDEKKRTTIPPDVRKRIWDYFKERIPPYCCVMMLCYKCLIRPNEIMKLRVRNIDFKMKTITVPADVAKNHHERIIKASDDVMELLKPYKGRAASLYLFTGNKRFMPGQKPMPHTRVSERWAEMREALGLPDTYQFYSLKDTGITEMLEAGVPSKYVKELADHSSLEVTENYIHKSDGKVVEVGSLLHF